MAEPNELVRLDHARMEIAAARTIDECKKISDKAEAARYYAKKIGMSLDTQIDLAEIVIEAQARAGEIIDDMKKSGGMDRGGRPPKKTGSTKEPVSGGNRYHLEDLGVTKKESHIFQKVAAVPAAARKRYFAQNREAKTQATTTGLLREQRTAEKEKEGGAKLPRSTKHDFDPPTECVFKVQEVIARFWPDLDAKGRQSVIAKLRRFLDAKEREGN